MPELTQSEWIGIEPLEFLWTGSRQMVDQCAKIELKNHRHILAELCFRRIMVMTLSFLRWNPLSSFFPQNGHWDLPSCAAIVRCIMETYLRLFYFGVETVSEAEGVFRALLSQYHAQFQQLEIATYSRVRPEILTELRTTSDQTRAWLEQCEHFRNLPENWKQ